MVSQQDLRLPEKPPLEPAVEVSRNWRSRAGIISLACLLFSLLVMSAELVHFIRNNSPTSDEGFHIAAGIRAWNCSDFAINPEHPPLAKLLATLAVHDWQIPETGGCPRTPTPKGEGFGLDYSVVNSPQGTTVVDHARYVMMVFPLMMLLALWGCALEVGGHWAASICALLTCFEPNFTAHGGLVTTDLPLAAMVFITLYFAWRYLEGDEHGRSRITVVLVGLVFGISLGTKHSAILLPPILLACFVTHWLLSGPQRQKSSARALFLDLLSFAVIFAIGIAVLWASYDFRFSALPHAPGGVYNLRSYFASNGRSGIPSLEFADDHHLLPESYLMGLADVFTENVRPGFIFGHQEAGGVWYYFPAAIAIKSTLTLLLMFFAGVWALLRSPRMQRALIFFSLPIVIFLGASMTSQINIGVRHVLPVYPFMVLLAATGCASLLREPIDGNGPVKKWLGAGIAALLVFQAVSFLRASPALIPYSNEAFGGVNNTYNLLSDSNSDWGQGAYAVERYVKDHHLSDCYYGWITVRPPHDTGCMDLGTYIGPQTKRIGGSLPVLPDRIGGTIFIPAQAVRYIYSPFHFDFTQRPDEILEGAVLVFHGEHAIPHVADVRKIMRGLEFMQRNQFEAALAEFAQCHPGDPVIPGAVEFSSAQALQALGRYPEARAMYLRAADRFNAPDFAARRMRNQALTSAASLPQ